MTGTDRQTKRSAATSRNRNDVRNAVKKRMLGLDWLCFGGAMQPSHRFLCADITCPPFPRFSYGLLALPYHPAYISGATYSS